MALTRPALPWMISISRRSGPDSPSDSSSSCAAWLIAPTGLRISCAMLADKPAQRGQLVLLDPRRLGAQVLQEDDRRAGPAMAQRREMRPHLAQAIGGDQRSGNVLVGARALAPGLQQEEQPWRHLAQQRPGRGIAGAQDLPRGLVDQPDAVLFVDHDDALAQPLDDVLRQLRQVGQVDVLLADQRLAFAHAVGQRRRGQRDDEDDRAQQPGLGKGARIGQSQRTSTVCCARTASAASAAMTMAERLATSRLTGADRHHQQQAEAAVRAAAGQHQQREGDDVEGDVEVGLQLQAGPAALEHADAQHAGHEHADQGCREQGRRGRAQETRGRCQRR